MYGQAGSTGNSWAGFFQGKVFATAGYLPSDEQLKSGIEDLEDALSMVLQLRPKRYFYNAAENPTLGLPEGPQAGFVAQDIAEILPEAVTQLIMPSREDENEVVWPGMSIQGVNYITLIPYLAGAIQMQEEAIQQEHTENEELRDMVSELASRLDQLEQALALCCTDPDRSESPLAPEGDLKLDPATERLLRIDPNPFTDRTTIRYTLELGGRTMLLVNSSDGKQLEVLQEAVQQAGEYQHEWHTDHLAPGIYYVTLLLDGEPLVKRAVKVN